jgi:coenzyme F420-reducing hydrogenase beta subunit
VLAESLCIGCGACAAVDPTIELRLDPRKLIYEPSHVGGPDAAAVCPAVQVDFAGLQVKLFPDQTPMLGLGSNAVADAARPGGAKARNCRERGAAAQECSAANHQIMVHQDLRALYERKVETVSREKWRGAAGDGAPTDYCAWP